MDRDALHDAIAEELHLIARLNDERNAAYARLEALQGRLRAGAAPRPATGLTGQEKVALFRRLFRGREDVFPKLWQNRKAGKKGYSPACANEWVRGLCEKPRVKCGECPHQAFNAVDDRAIVDHLKGRHVMGVYPLLRDETCRFLAADFDKGGWQEDVTAFRETCRAFGLPVAVERSRSGAGAHAWLFFDSPVPASLARKLGCYLLTETMARRHELGLGSYDRLFPNQDTMPQGGFGNLIALPLQREAREHGNSVFLDEALVPHPDQWSYLASLVPIPAERVETLAREAEQRGRVIGVRMSLTEDDPTPWLHRPAPRRPHVPGPLPAAIDVVLANRLFIAKEGLPSALLNQFMRLAAFQNPEFYKKQSMRMSTALTPRVITCAEDLSHHVVLPRGCLPDLEALCADHGIEVRREDQRESGEALELRFDGELTGLQKEALDALEADELGVFVAPPGIGKTVVGIASIAARGRSTLVLVHRKPLLEQWIAQLARFLGEEPKAIGQIGGGKDRRTGRIDVAMLQSLVRQDEEDAPLTGYGHVVVDECHHLPAISFERVLARLRPRFVTGLTATPYRRDGHQPIIHMQCGPVRYEVDTRQRGAERPFAQRLIVRETGFRIEEASADLKIQPLYAALVADDARNALILADVRQAMAEGRSPILLTERKDHLEAFAAALRPEVPHLIILKGGTTSKVQRETAQRLAEVPDDAPRLILATGRYIGEGFDDARLDTLFLALPVSWKGTLVQYAGRLHRLHATKQEVRIYDYADVQVPMLAKMFEKRLRGYRAIGYERAEGNL